MSARFVFRLLPPSAILALALLAAPARAWDEWAYSVLGYSSQYNEISGAATEVLDLPNITYYGDNNHAWIPSTESGSPEFISVSFLEPLYATGATVRETFGNGFVSKIEALDMSGVYHTVWTGTDPSQPGSIVDFQPTWPKTAYLVQGLRVSVNTSHSSSWEEIDAIGLSGEPVAPLQWASRVIAVSSEYGTSPDNWSSARALGAADVIGYGDSPNSWAPANQNGTTEFITLGFPTSAPSTGLTIRETYGNGFVTKIEALDTGGVYHSVWTGQDTSAPNAPAWFTASWAQTSYSVQGVRISTNTGHTTVWEEIDAVYVHGPQASAPPPTISTLNPAIAYREGPAFTLTVNGQGFVNNSVVRWNGSDRATTYVSPTQLTAQIPASDIALPASVSITVYSPPPAGGLSASSPFTVSTDLAQWASTVIGFSSQYSTVAGGNSATDALGVPDVFVLHDNGKAWAADGVDRGPQYLTLGYRRVVQADEVVVRESNAPGFVTKVELLDVDGAYHTAWTGTDPSPATAIADFRVTFPQTAYHVWGVRVSVDTNHKASDWEEIDAVQLLGLPIVPPAPSITGVGRNPLLKSGPSFALRVDGSGFQPNTVIRWAGSDRPTTYVSPTRMAVSLTAADTSSAATVAVTAYTPAPGGGTSAAFNVTVGPALWGDVNANGVLDASDAAQALRAAAGINKPTNPPAGDVSPDYPASGAYGDGRVGVGDAVRILLRVRGTW